MYNHSYGRHRSTSKLVIGSLIILACVVAGLIFFTSTDKQQIVPQSIVRKISFQIYSLPRDSKIWQISNNSVKYDDKQTVLSLTYKALDNQLSITEQKTPSQFTDIPQYYPALLNKLHQYSVLQTHLGDVYLTKPTELNGAQTAVLNSNGTLMFIRPQGNLSDTQWKTIFDDMIVIH